MKVAESVEVYNILHSLRNNYDFTQRCKMYD